MFSEIFIKNKDLRLSIGKAGRETAKGLIWEKNAKEIIKAMSIM